MDAFDIGDNNLMRSYNSNALPKIKRLLRIIEIILILIILTSATTRLPLAIKVTGEYLRHVVIFLISPFFIFLIGNVIVLTLFFKSRNDIFHKHEYQQNPQISTDTLFDFGQESINNVDESPHGQGLDDNIVYQDKQTIFEVKRSNTNCSSSELRQLHRSKMETRRRVVDRGEVAVEMVERLSNEEFKREIEDFIARQTKFHQQEKLSIVLRESI